MGACSRLHRTQAAAVAAGAVPSRAGFFSGRLQSRFGYDVNPTGTLNLLPNAGLPDSETTFIARLSDAGYRTALIGKWHLGATPAKHPLSRGHNRPAKLYHLADDASEANDLAASHPDVLQQLAAAWENVNREMAPPIELAR